MFTLTLETFMLRRAVLAEMILSEANKTSSLFDQNILAGSRIGYHFAGVGGMALLKFGNA